MGSCWKIYSIIKQEKMINNLYKILGHSFKEESLLREALSHRSMGAKNNERMEFLGDSILGFIISVELYKKFPKASEGELTRLRASLVKGETLASCARELSLDQYLRLGPGELKSGGHKRQSILEDALEAIIGALYLDAGIEVAKSCVLKWYKSRLECIDMSYVSKDPKTELQEWLQAKQLALPKYEIVNIQGEEHEQTFTIRCIAESIDIAVEAEGVSRRKAEQSAARNVLKRLQKK